MFYRAPVPLLYFFVISFPTFAQLQWKRVDKEFGSLPKSIKVYKTTDSLNGHPFIAYYVEARLKDKNLDFTTQTGNGYRLTPDQYYQHEDSPYVIVNGPYFSMQTGQNLNLVIRDGKMVAYNVPALKSRYSDSFYYPTRGAIGISRNRRPDIAWTFTDTSQRWPYAFQNKPVIAKGKTSDPVLEDLRTLDYWTWWHMQTAIGGGPVLIKNKQLYISSVAEQMPDSANARHPRTAMGYKKRRRLIILVIQGRFPGIAEGATLQEEAKILLDLKCKEALNLDGGGSSCLLINGKETIKPSDKEGQRAIPAIFIIRKRQE